LKNRLRVFGCIIFVAFCFLLLTGLFALYSAPLLVTVFAALLGVMPVSLAVLYNEWVKVPQLEFVFEQDSSEFVLELHAGWPLAGLRKALQRKATLVGGKKLEQGPTQWLRVGVRNLGKGTAFRCRGQIEVVEWPGEQGIAPAPERKVLKWASAGVLNVTEGPGASADIYPGAMEHLAVLVNPAWVPLEVRNAYNGGKAPKGPIVCWAATPFAYPPFTERGGVMRRLQDGFAAGSYRIRLQVTANNLSRSLTKEWELELKPLSEEPVDSIKQYRTEMLLKRIS
jgi:hypothetical protein